MLDKPDFDEVMTSYPEFNKSLQKISAGKAAGEGWDRVRQVLKMANTIRLFGGNVSVEDMLLGAPKKKLVDLPPPPTTSGKGSVIFGKLKSKKSKKTMSGHLAQVPADAARPSSS